MPEVYLDCLQVHFTAYPLMWFSNFSPLFWSVHFSFQWRLQCWGNKLDRDGLYPSPRPNVKSGLVGTRMLIWEALPVMEKEILSQAKTNTWHFYSLQRRFNFILIQSEKRKLLTVSSWWSKKSFWMCNIMYNTEHNMQCRTLCTLCIMLQEMLTGFEITWSLNTDPGNRHSHSKIIWSCLCNPNSSECMKPKTSWFDTKFLHFATLKPSSVTASG